MSFVVNLHVEIWVCLRYNNNAFWSKFFDKPSAKTFMQIVLISESCLLLGNCCHYFQISEINRLGNWIIKNNKSLTLLAKIALSFYTFPIKFLFPVIRATRTYLRMGVSSEEILGGWRRLREGSGWEVAWDEGG